MHRIWEEEDPFIDDYESATSINPKIINSPRSIHFILKPAEDGISEPVSMPPTYSIGSNIDLLPGRLSLHKYENKIAERWSGVYQGDNLSIRTVTNIRSICQKYTEINTYDYVLIDTSPSLGILNKVIISTVDGFFIPAQPDMFSLYGIRNIGNALQLWQREFMSIYSLISEEKRAKFPSQFVQFLGYTIYNAKKYTRNNEPFNEYNLAQAHFQYVNQIQETILQFIQESNRAKIPPEVISKPIGGPAIIHSHNTFPAMAQALKCPMWRVPEVYAKLEADKPEYLEFLNQNGFDYNRGNNGRLREVGERYREFTEDLITRINTL